MPKPFREQGVAQEERHGVVLLRGEGSLSHPRHRRCWPHVRSRRHRVRRVVQRWRSNGRHERVRSHQHGRDQRRRRLRRRGRWSRRARQRRLCDGRDWACSVRRGWPFVRKESWLPRGEALRGEWLHRVRRWQLREPAGVHVGHRLGNVRSAELRHFRCGELPHGRRLLRVIRMRRRCRALREVGELRVSRVLVPALRRFP